MTETKDHLNIPIEKARKLAIAAWLMNQWLGENHVSGKATVLKHINRQLNDIVAACKIQTIDPTNSMYDAGMAATVLEKIEDDSLEAGSCKVIRTLQPIILLDSTVLSCGQIVVAHNNKSVDATIEAAPAPEQEPAQDLEQSSAYLFSLFWI